MPTLRDHYASFIRSTGRLNTESQAMTWLCFQDEYNQMSQSDAYKLVTVLAGIEEEI